MGCSGGRTLDKAEEQGIYAQEQYLQFQRTNVKKMDLIFRKFAKNHMLSLEHFKEAARQLKINIGAYKAADFAAANIKDQRIVDFYETLKIETKDETSGSTDKFFDQYKLIILGVFLGRGSNLEKCEILFENFDRDMNNKISKAEFKSMWEDVFTVIVGCTYFLSRGNVNCLVNPNQLKSYRENLSAGKNVAYEEMENAVFCDGEEVTKEQFLMRMVDLQVPELYTSIGYRQYLYQKFLSLPDSSDFGRSNTETTLRSNTESTNISG